MTHEEARRAYLAQQVIDQQKKTGGIAGEAMTLRDYFAAAAMQSMVLFGGRSKIDSCSDGAAAAYRVADAMMEARK